VGNMGFYTDFITQLDRLASENGLDLNNSVVKTFDGQVSCHFGSERLAVSNQFNL
jgi:hypothetical protein